MNLVYDHDLISFCSQSPDTSVVSGVSTNSSIGPSASCIGAQNPLPAPPKSFDFGRIVAVSAPYGKLPTTSVAPIKPTQVVSPVANTKVCQTKRKLSEFYTSPKRSSRQISPAKPQQQRLIIKSGKENNSSQMTLTVKPNASGVSSQRTPQFNWKRSATVSTDQSSSSDDE